MLYQVLIVVYLIVALCLIGLVLIQQGKGADMGASFGAGSSATIFGSSGSGNFLTKATTYLAIAFFVISLVLGNLTANRVKATDEWNNIDVPAGQVAPATDAIPTDSVEPKVNNSDVPSSDTVTEKDSDVPG
ncbi:preprotein translocase subunit SecG [Cognaticolwellia aestuarii]|jgi:preprotein translocase subunit SecG|uniref:preprotein translocase subunit SecG n=1 Tax=Cognaticolwellia aestuarii TaxID=329993 RepID=UPI0007915A0E|nr:preprotein translocase subunit SecG [Cognaticolwellia aestuarii]KXJ50183.1 MAG: preprotein translocase subunit SecG [Colwellia sp. Phe_37]|tara:strand:- start:372 stop:767 length:396 start_codon:yes stop_codon:yes gene_type:complete